MGPGAGSGTTELYRHALNQLRRNLTPTLDALDRAAADPHGLDDHAEELPALQYALHAAAEWAVELDLGPRHHSASAELEIALAVAREETAGVAETFEEAGTVAAGTLVWEWRVALFSVRLALLELERQGVDSVAPASIEGRALPLVLLGLGVAAVLGGALVSLWPVWVLGLAFVTASTALAQRRP